MKAKALQLRKAMSAALFVLLLVVVGSKNALAQTQVAILQHGDDVSAFYGTNALVEAYATAQTGDIITLSSGSFTPPNTINKAITLRGSGVACDTVSGTLPTVITSSFTLDVANDSIPLVIEGIAFRTNSNTIRYKTLVNPKFIKCCFDYISYDFSSDLMTGAQFINCIINKINLDRTSYTSFINSVVWDAYGFSDNHTLVIYNSILGRYNINQGGLSAYNSILIQNTNSGYLLYTSCTFFNCIGMQVSSRHPFEACYNTGCVIYTSYEDVFESFTGEFSLGESFILKDEIVTGFLGSDGTQVGIYGGAMPYSSRLSYMVMKRCNVANKSTIDGKLSVDIEVVTEE